MEVGIECGGGKPGLGAFYRARAAQRCGGTEAIRWSAAIGTSLY
jgi:hypothetical protein